MLKENRARIILGQILSLDRMQGRASLDENGDPIAQLRQVAINNRWEASIRRSVVPSAQAHDKAFAPELWNQLHVRAEDGLKLALHFLEHRIRLIVFDPGPWESWFGTFNALDREAVRP